MANKRTAAGLAALKAKGGRIAALTAYDFPTGRLADRAGVDVVLVGDSLGMVIHGEPDTLRVTVGDVAYHCRCVSRAVRKALLVADMPFGSCHVSPARAAFNAIRLVREGRAEAVKIEGGRVRLPAIRAVLDCEIPVMGHLGLTPQSVNRFGGYRVQGRESGQIDALVEDALALEKEGCFAIVLECIPSEVAAVISGRIRIPTIGIGAGSACDGQVLVFHDMLGLTADMDFRFVRVYAQLGAVAEEAIRHYAADVRSGAFPKPEEAFPLEPSSLPLLEKYNGSHHQD